MNPTYLYIKKHTVTGMKYLGKTTRNPETYLGSGVYWRKHIRKHGKTHVINVWKHLFLNESDLVEFATFLSEELNVVKDESYANLVIEDGKGGASMPGERNPMFGKVGAMKGRTGNQCPMFGNGFRISGEKHGMFGKSGDKSPRSKPIIIDGVKYESAHLASKSLGVPRATISNRCRSDSDKFVNWRFA